MLEAKHPVSGRAHLQTRPVGLWSSNPAGLSSAVQIQKKVCWWGGRVPISYINPHIALGGCTTLGWNISPPERWESRDAGTEQGRMAFFSF